MAISRWRAGRAGEQARHVRAGDEQHDGNQPLQDDERPFERASQRRQTTIRGNEREGLAEKAFPRVRELREELPLDLLLFALLVQDPHGGLRLLERHAWLQPGEIEPVIPLVLEIALNSGVRVIFAVTGAQSWVSSPALVPPNSGAATPTIVNGAPFSGSWIR